MYLLSHNTSVCTLQYFMRLYSSRGAKLIWNVYFCMRQYTKNTRMIFILLLFSPPPPSPHDTLSRRKRGVGWGGGGGEVGRELRPSVPTEQRGSYIREHSGRYRAVWRWSLQCKNLEVSVKIILVLSYEGSHSLSNRFSSCIQYKKFRMICLYIMNRFASLHTTMDRRSKEIIFFKHTFNATVSRDFSFIDSGMNGWILSMSLSCTIILSNTFSLGLNFQQTAH